MPRGGQKAVPEGKGPVSQGKPGDNLLDEFRRLIQEFKQDFHNHCDDIKQQLREFGNMEKRLDGRMEGMQHKMLQLRPAVETGAKGEKTGERKEGAVVNGGHGDTPFNRGNESPSACAREEQLFSNNEEQGHLVLFKSGTSSRRQIADSRRGEISSGELYSSDMQSVAERTVFQMVPLAESDTAVAVACSSSGEKSGDESSQTSFDRVMTNIPVSGSRSVMKNRMLRGAMNPTPVVCKLFDPGGQGRAYEVSSASGSTVRRKY